MRLLRLGDGGELSIRQYDYDKIPPYAILSHTWGPSEDEITFEDIINGTGKEKRGYAKIRFCGEQALKDENIKDFWVDTCCIDKRNHSELDESIRSMFRWYERAEKCYVYLEDVSTLKRDNSGQRQCDWESSFRRSKWFTRSWTLQELLAPKVVEFWSRDRYCLGSKARLQDLISAITEIPKQALAGIPLSSFEPNERFRWAVQRNATKIEDKAYSLCGVFNVGMSIRYGEGEDAFARLKKKVAKKIHRSTEDVFSPNWPSHDAPGDGDDPSPVPWTAPLDRRKQLLESLSFDQMDVRQSMIDNPQRKTCEWLLQHPLYRDWADRDKPARTHDILWVAGHPGTGKSTIINYALSHAQKQQGQDEIILSFFFNARGDEIEKTTLGMYRSLLFQLLTKVPDLQQALDEIGGPQISEGQSFGWTISVLQKLLADSIERLLVRKLQFKCFIDALDECNEQQVREMLMFMEDLGEDSPSDGGRLYICFSSRHYPTIEVASELKIVLDVELGHAEDLRKFIHRRLRTVKGKPGEQLRAQVEQKANGVFMWAKLVIEELNKELKDGRLFAVEARLNEIPGELSDLYKYIIRRDRANMDDVLLCLQWILFAKRPLSLEEFYFAMRAGLQPDSEHCGRWKPEPWDTEQITPEIMRKYLISSSKGFAEVMKLGKKPRVQFIHESVKDFLVKDGGLCDLWPHLCDGLESKSHERLKHCCWRYVVVDASNYLKVCSEIFTPLPKARSPGARIMRQEVNGSFPFLEYACEYVLNHADNAAHIVSQTDFLQKFSIYNWTNIANLLEQYDIDRHSNIVTLPYVLAEKNCARLIGKLGDPAILWHRTSQERYPFPILAAFARGNREALHALIDLYNPDLVDEIARDRGYGRPSWLSVCSPIEQKTHKRFVTTFRSGVKCSLAAHFAGVDLSAVVERKLYDGLVTRFDSGNERTTVNTSTPSAEMNELFE